MGRLLMVFLLMVGAFSFCSCSDDDEDTPAVISVTGVSLNSSSVSLEPGQSQTLVVTVAPPNAANQQVDWSSSNPSVATVDQSGKVTAVAAGTATITVTSKDGGFSASSTVTVANKEVAVSGIQIAGEDAISLTVGDNKKLEFTIEPADATNKSVKWTSSDTDVAIVDETGQVTIVGPGEAVITVTTEDGDFSASVSLTAVPQPVSVEGVSLASASLSLNEGESVALTAVITPEDATDQSVTWESSDEKVITVDADGNVKAVGAGEATITVTTNDGSKTASCKVTVSVAVASVSLDQTSLTLTEGETATLKATVLPENATNKKVTWTSSNAKVATVDANGKITAVSAGTAKITVTTEDGKKTATSTVTVKSKSVSVTGVTLDNTSLSINIGETKTLKATVIPTGATNKKVTWTSSNAKIASVDANGKVTAVAAGTATITVTTEDGKFTATCKVNVQDPTVYVYSITLSSTSLEMEVGDTKSLKATIYPSFATDKSLTWFSNNTKVAIVDAKGNVTAVAPGTTLIFCSSNDGGSTTTCTVTVSNGVGNYTGGGQPYSSGGNW